MGVLETYVIGKGVLESEDTRNLLLDSETIIGAAVPSASDIRHSIDAGRAASFVVITDIDLLSAIDSGSAIGVGIVSSSLASVVNISDLVVGLGVISAVQGDLLSTVIGIAEVSADESQDHEDAQRVVGKANIYEGEQDVSGTVIGLGDLNWPASGGKDRYSAIDSGTIIGSGTPSTSKEGADFFLSGEINAHTNCGSGYGDEFVLDETALDDPVMTLGEKFILNTDTVDYYLLTGVAEIRSMFDESGTVVGVGETNSENPDALGRISSKGFTETGSAEGEGIIDAHIATTLDGGTIDLYGNPLNDGIVTGVADIGTAVEAVVLNAAANAIADKFALRYSISSIDSYTYVPALAGVIKGSTSLSVNLEVAVSLEGSPAGVSSLGTTNDSSSGTPFGTPISTSTSRYDYTYPSGTSFPVSPSDGDLFYRSDEDKYYIYRASSSSWAQTNRPEGKYDVGEYS
jgi:hypothetical protein